jgi:hypothetical protein
LSDEHHIQGGGIGAWWLHQKRAAKRRQQEPNMTAAFTRTLRQAGLVLAFAVSISAVSSTSSFAFSAEAQQMCTGDAFRLCGSEIPNVSKITACMIKQRTSLSAGCRTVMDKELAQKSSKVAAN